MIFVSAAYASEITNKARRGNLRHRGTRRWRSGRRRRMGLPELPASLDHGQRLPGSYKDLFDRLLIAQAQAENLPIVSSDRIFDDCRMRRIW